LVKPPAIEALRLAGNSSLMDTGGHIMANPREHCHPPLQIEVDHAVVVSLRPEARRRDVPLKRLVTDLLDVIGEEPGLVGAILDSENSA
jgi:hypothetical protein